MGLVVASVVGHNTDQNAADSSFSFGKSQGLLAQRSQPIEMIVVVI